MYLALSVLAPVFVVEPVVVEPVKVPEPPV